MLQCRRKENYEQTSAPSVMPNVTAGIYIAKYQSKPCSRNLFLWPFFLHLYIQFDKYFFHGGNRPNVAQFNIQVKMLARSMHVYGTFQDNLITSCLTRYHGNESDQVYISHLLCKVLIFQ